MAEQTRGETEEIGVIQPSLQQVWTPFAQDARQSDDAARIESAAGYPERFHPDPGACQDPFHRPAHGHADDERGKSVTITSRRDTRQHPLRATRLQPGDQVDDPKRFGHVVLPRFALHAASSSVRCWFCRIREASRTSGGRAPAYRLRANTLKWARTIENAMISIARVIPSNAST